MGSDRKEIGIKFDKKKPRTDLLPPKSLIEVSKVLGFGADKYKPNNWKYVENWRSRYIGAAMRHIIAIMDGEEYDPESGFHHAAHAICCMMFYYDNFDETCKAFAKIGEIEYATKERE